MTKHVTKRVTNGASHDEGNTPLDDEERDSLIPPHVTSRTELNQWEAGNISSAHEWLSNRRAIDVLQVDFLKELHRRMFGATWKWAGVFRQSDTTIGPHSWTQVPALMRDLVDNIRTQYTASSRSANELDEIAARFHHGLTRIHPWPNGNGRHARLAADLLLRQWGRPAFTWGRPSDLTAAADARSRYLDALERADGGDFSRLNEFVRS